MDTPVIRDITDGETPTACPARDSQSSEAPAPERTPRRFAFDPASSPVLLAALAWDTAAAS